MRGQLWRASNPELGEAERQHLVEKLMDARRAIGAALKTQDKASEKHARAQVHAAKMALGERGPVWWSDGAPDENRKRIEHSSYAQWYRSVQVGD